jgi:hypothetical protein
MFIQLWLFVCCEVIIANVRNFPGSCTKLAIEWPRAKLDALIDCAA